MKIVLRVEKYFLSFLKIYVINFERILTGWGQCNSRSKKAMA